MLLKSAIRLNQSYRPNASMGQTASPRRVAWYPTRIAISWRRGYTLALRVVGADHGPVSLRRTGRTITQYCRPEPLVLPAPGRGNLPARMPDDP